MRNSYVYILCVCLCVLSACDTPQQQQKQEAIHAPQVRQDVLVAEDGTLLPVRFWTPVEKPRAVIVALHGFNDYSRAFSLPGEYLRLHGYAVMAYDQRGFGSTRQRGIWGGADNLAIDALNAVLTAQTLYPDTPLYLLGESMGGAVAIAAASREDFPRIQGIILVAPAVWGGETLNPILRLMLNVAAYTWPEKILTGSDLKILASNNIEMLRALGRDPLVIKGARIDAIYGLVQLMDKAHARLPSIKLPMLILYGGSDQVIPAEPVRMAMAAPSSHVMFAYYPRGYHMLLRDLRGDIVVRDMMAWMHNSHASLPSGADREASRWINKKP